MPCSSFCSFSMSACRGLNLASISACAFLISAVSTSACWRLTMAILTCAAAIPLNIKTAAAVGNRRGIRNPDMREELLRWSSNETLQGYLQVNIALCFSIERFFQYPADGPAWRLHLE